MTRMTMTMHIAVVAVVGSKTQNTTWESQQY